jgi:hypothetical protein
MGRSGLKACSQPTEALLSGLNPVLLAGQQLDEICKKVDL